MVSGILAKLQIFWELQPMQSDVFNMASAAWITV